MSPAALHADTRRLLLDWSAPDDAQDALRADYIAHLDAYSDGVLRQCRAGHITASSIIVDTSRESVLLTLHPIVGRWLQTGGHCEADDAALVTAAAREASEESGIDNLRIDVVPLRLDRHAVRCRDDDGLATTLDHLDVQFLVVAPACARETRTHESLDLRWWHWDALPADTDASVQALVAAARVRCAT